MCCGKRLKWSVPIKTTPLHTIKLYKRLGTLHGQDNCTNVASWNALPVLWYIGTKHDTQPKPYAAKQLLRFTHHPKKPTHLHLHRWPGDPRPSHPFELTLDVYQATEPGGVTFPPPVHFFRVVWLILAAWLSTYSPGRRPLRLDGLRPINSSSCAWTRCENTAKLRVRHGQPRVGDILSFPLLSLSLMLYFW